MTILANTHGQPLEQHLIGVALKALKLLDELKIKDQAVFNDLFTIIFFSASIHDIGKIDSNFQNYINKQKKRASDYSSLTDAENERKKFIGPYHNEISFCLNAKSIKYINQNIHEAINYCIYWHHPANLNTDDKISSFYFDSADKIEEECFKNNDEFFFEKLKKFYNEEVLSFLKESLQNHIDTKPGLENTLFKKGELTRTSRPEYVCEHLDGSFRWAAIKRLVLNLLIEADRWVSSLSVQELENFIEVFNFEQDEDYNQNTFVFKNNPNERSKLQFELSEKVSKSKMSICAIDPGAGKTSIAISAHALVCNEQHKTQKLFIALPRQLQVTGLFYTIQEDLKRLFENTDNFSIEGVFSGERQHSTSNAKEGLLNSDICIMTFDRFLSPCYERRQFSDFMSMLRASLVIDEFHEFAWLPRMIYPLQEILQIRKWIDSGQKTLLLSGTPDKSLIRILDLNDAKFFSRSELPATFDSETKINFSNEKSDLEQKEDQLLSFNTIEQLHEHLLEIDIENCEIIHSKYRDQDKKLMIDSILEKHGPQARDVKTVTVTAKILQSSFNLNYKNAALKISHPNTDAQTWGRINRFGNKEDGQIYMIEEENLKIFQPSMLGFQRTITKWQNYLEEKIPKSKNYKTNIRGMLSQLYDDFWDIEENANVAYKELHDMVQKCQDDLRNWFPFRDQYKFKKGEKDKRGNSGKFGFRGQSLLLSAVVKDNEGNSISQLTGNDLLTVSTGYEISSYRKLLHSLSVKGDAINKIKGEKIFNYNKYSTQSGFIGERPFLCSHFNEVTNNSIATGLEIQENLKLHRYYNEFFGLINAETFERLKKKP